MIALDNTPARGDYVRYIDDLMARAARAAPAVVSNDGDMASGVNALLRERSNAAATGTGSADWSPTAPSVRRTRPPAAATASGFTPPTAAAAASAALANAASALMSGQVGRRASLSAATLAALAAVVLGIALVVAGVLWHPFNLAVVVGGGALIGWAVRRMKADAIGRTRSA